MGRLIGRNRRHLSLPVRRVVNGISWIESLGGAGRRGVGICAGRRLVCSVFVRQGVEGSEWIWIGGTATGGRESLPDQFCAEPSDGGESGDVFERSEDEPCVGCDGRISCGIRLGRNGDWDRVAV